MDTSTPATAPAQPVTVSDILNRFERDYLPYELAESTQREYRRHLRVLHREFGWRNPDEMKPKDFGPFLAVQRGKFQRGKQLSVLSAALTQAVSTWYMCETNVMKFVKLPKSKPRDRLITDDEFRRLRAMAPMRVQIAMDLALITGQRQGDILKFRWSDISDLAQPLRDPKTGAVIATQELNVRQKKTGKRIGIAITPELEAVLDRCWVLPTGGADGGEWILARRIGGRYTAEGFRALWQRTRRKWVKRGNESARFHDIRAMAATKQPTIEHAQLLLGHSSPNLTRRVYRRAPEHVVPTTIQLGA